MQTKPNHISRKYIFSILTWSMLLCISMICTDTSAQKVIGKTKLDNSDGYITTYDLKHYGEFTYLTFLGRDSNFVNDKFTFVDKKVWSSAFYYKFDKDHKLVQKGEFSCKKFHCSPRDIYYHKGIAYFCLRAGGDLYYNGEKVATEQLNIAHTYNRNFIIVGVDEVTDKVVFVKGMEHADENGFEAIGFYEDRMYLGGLINGDSILVDGTVIHSYCPLASCKTGFLATYDLATGALIHTDRFGGYGYEEIHEIQVDSKGYVYLLTSNSFGGVIIINEQVEVLGKGGGGSIIHKYDKEGRFVSYRTQAIYEGNYNSHDNMIILPDDRLAIGGYTYGYIKLSETEIDTFPLNYSRDLTVFDSVLNVAWYDTYCIETIPGTTALIAQDHVGSIYARFANPSGPIEIQDKEGNNIERGQYLIKYNGSGTKEYIRILDSYDRINQLEVIGQDTVVIYLQTPPGEYSPLIGKTAKFHETYLVYLDLSVSTGIIDDDSMLKGGMSLIPNPVVRGDVVHISGINRTISCQVYDMMGSLRHNVKMDESAADIIVDTNELAAGIYVVHMTYQDKRKESKKLILVE